MIPPPLKLFRVSGTSMVPTYNHGDVLIGTPFGRLKPGDVVVVRRKLVLVKRVIKVNRSQVWVEGDNRAESTDSREFGWVDRSDVLARIMGRLARG